MRSGAAPTKIARTPCDYLNYGTDFKPLINQKGWRTYYDPYSLVPYMLREDGKPDSSPMTIPLLPSIAFGIPIGRVGSAEPLSGN